MSALPAPYVAARIALDDARRALAEATHVDQAKDIRAKAVAVQTYAKQARDTELIAPATEIRVTAETRAGELLIDMSGRKERARGGEKGRRESQRVTLADLDISKMQSSRWQLLARLKKQNPKKWKDRLDKIIRMNIASTAGDAAVIKAARLAMRLERIRKRNDKERELSRKIKALPTKRYGVIYADPEWRFKTWDGLSAASEHYNTSELDVIKARDVPSISAKDSVLFLWAIVPMLPHALEVMTAWGFEYVSHAMWDKMKPGRMGTGYWFINHHELLLVGKRGKIPAPAPGTQWPSIIREEATVHSAKPQQAFELIEQYFPLLPKIELNRRGPPRPGWDAWGAEALEP